MNSYKFHSKQFYFFSSALIFMLIIINSSLTAQSNEAWEIVNTEKGKILSINKTGLDAFKENEIFVWVKEEFKEPLQMDAIENDIYTVKSYYTINKELRRYSLIDVIYYDKNNNVIKSFHYSSNYEDPIYKYNMPIVKKSDMELVLGKCLLLINNQ